MRSPPPVRNGGPVLEPDRRDLLAGLSIVSFAAMAPTIARSQSKVARIGYLASVPPASTPDLLNAFSEGLRQKGHTEGVGFKIEYLAYEGNRATQNLSTELARLRIDLLLAWSTPAVKAAKGATNDIPIVMVGIADPIESGFVASLARPGGNITGSTNVSRELSGKLLELLVSLAPGIARFAALRNPGNPAGEIQWKETEEAARLMRMEAKLVDVYKREEFERAFTSAAEAQAGGAVLLADPLFFTRRVLIADLAIRHRLPMISARRENVEAGLLASYGPSLRDQFRQASHYVDLILKGAKPADLPVQQPTTFELALNRKAARALGLAIPPTLLARADEVIE